MHFKLTIEQEGGALIWRTEAPNVEDGIEQFEVAVLAGEVTLPKGLLETGYQHIEIGWAMESMGRWE
jgi:hypothetical protein